MWLIIDDTRDLNCEVIARTGKSGLSILYSMHKSFDCLCIDHDLGMASEYTGYDVIVEAAKADCLPPRVQIVSQNPVGAENIRNALIHDCGYETQDNINFYKKEE